VQLLGAFLQWTQRLLEPVTSRLQLELPQLLFDRGFTAAIFLFGLQLLAEALLFRPELFLDDAVLGVAAALV
jgi:hypothetical protein